MTSAGARSPDPARGRAIVTFSRSWPALAVIRSLGRKGVEVIAGDEYAITPGSLSRYTAESFRYPSPAFEPHRFLETLDRIIDEHQPKALGVPYVLMPVHRETQLIARCAARFAGRISVPIARAEQFELLSHKGRLAKFAREIGVAVPDFWTPGSREELRQIAPRVAFPALVKMPSGTAGLGIEKVESPEELCEAFDAFVDEHRLEGDEWPVIQQWTEGDDYCTLALCQEGRMVVALSYRNVMTFPRDGGPGAIRETIEAPLLETATAQLLQAVGWHGVAEVDFRWSGSNMDTPLMIEVNPRFSSGLFQAIESGVDFPWLLYRTAAGLPLDLGSISVGARTETPFAGLVATVGEIVDRATESGPLEFRERLERVRRMLEQKRESVSMLADGDDPLPLLGVIYPLLILLRHGKVSTELLVGAERSVGFLGEPVSPPVGRRPQTRPGSPRPQ